MELIDENGNLFGAVNVVDALVVLLVLAVVVAGVAVVGVLGTADDDDDEDEEETEDEDLIETHYATLEIGTESTATAEAVTTGDEMTVGDERLEITDTYAVPTSSDSAHVTVQAEIEATEHENGTLSFDDSELATGQNVSVETDDYDVTGSVEALDTDTTAFQTDETEVLFEQTVDQETAAEIRAGNVSQLGDETLATLEDVSVYPTDTNEYRVVAGATLSTLETDDVRYGPSLVDAESTITFATEEYTLEPTIIETGTTTQPGEETTTTVEIDLDELEDREAAQFEPGLTESMGGDTWATITDVDREPASIIVETDDGNLHERDHPTEADVTLTVDLETHETELGTQFQGSEFRNGDTVYLDFGITTVEEHAWVVD